MLYAYLTVAPPNDIDLIIGGAMKRIFKLPRSQIYHFIPHYTPHFGEVVLGERRSPYRKKEGPLKKNLQELSLYLRPGRKDAPSSIIASTRGSLRAEICIVS